jgi:hypothetical protein
VGAIQHSLQTHHANSSSSAPRFVRFRERERAGKVLRPLGRRRLRLAGVVAMIAEGVGTEPG